MRELDEPSPDTEVMLTPLRLALLAGASLIAPAILIVQERGNDDARSSSSARRSSCSASSSRAWPASCASRSAPTARERLLSHAGAALVAARDATRRSSGRARRRSASLLAGVGNALLCRQRDRRAARHRRAATATPVDQRRSLSAPPTARAAASWPTIAGTRPELADRRRSARAELAPAGRATTARSSSGCAIRGEVRGLLVVARPVLDGPPLARARCARWPRSSRSRSRAPR